MTNRLPLNGALETLPVYQPGRPIEEVARELGLPAADIIKLASNENALGPSRKAVQAISQALAQLHLYPDGNAFYFKNRLAEKLGVTPQHLILGNGSNEIIEFVGHALLRPGSNIVVSEYCFAIYPIVALLFGAEIITVPAKNHGHDLRAMLKAITPQTRIVFVANPNNPTGTAADPSEIVELVDGVPDDVLLVMDEAYIEFLQDPLELIPGILAGRQNLLLMRTFSKIYGLAGLRLGYGIGAPALVSALEKIRQPFNINSLAQAAGLAALADTDHLRKTAEMTREGIQFLQSGFDRLGLRYVPSFANFVLVHVGQGQQVFQELQKKGVIVRPMGGYRLPEWIRVTVGTRPENQRFLDTLEPLLKMR